jgi:hypothetical protein
MSTHKYFGHNSRIRLINNLKSILDYRGEPYHKNELYSYSNSEIKSLIRKYDIKLNGVDDINNSWYSSRRHYLPKPYNFIKYKSHHIYHTCYVR